MHPPPPTNQPPAEELWRLSATEAVARLKSGRVTPLQLVDAAQARHAATDGLIHAMPITCWGRARQCVEQLMRDGFPPDPPPGYLYGLPVAVKDVTAVKGLPLTHGCVALKDCVAEQDDPLVQRLLEHGAIIVGKTNTPEFGAGSQTFNRLFGTTLNPWDTRKTVGGSSGGSCAALAVGQVWLATGTDLGGSLRNPAAYCGVVGLRPSVGVVPHVCEPRVLAQLQDRTLPHWRLQGVSGLLARSAQDLALGLDAVAGPHPQDPRCLAAPAPSFAAAVAARLASNSSSSSSSGARPRRVAFSADLGVPPVEEETAQLCRAAAGWWEQQGASLAEAAPDLADMQEVFLTLRAFMSQGPAAQLLGDARFQGHIKEDLLWQLELGQSVTQEQVERAVAAHQRMLDAAHAFFETHDLLLCPTVALAPFDASLPWPRELNGHTFDNYVAWMKSCSLLSALDLPAASVPCGLTQQGLPVGLQLVGPPGADAAVLAEAAAYEAAHEFVGLVPRDVRVVVAAPSEEAA